MKRLHILFLFIMVLFLSGCAGESIRINHYVFSGRKEWEDFKLPVLIAKNKEMESSLSSLLDSVIAHNTKNNYIPTDYVLVYKNGEGGNSFFLEEGVFELYCSESMRCQGVYFFNINGTEMRLFIENQDRAREDPIFDNTGKKINFSVINYPLPKDSYLMYFHHFPKLHVRLKDNKFCIDSII